MADKFSNNQRIYVEADYDNIYVVDPNKVYDENGRASERLVNHEELVMYANLEANIIPRTKLDTGVSYDDAVQNIRIASLDVNFLKPKGKEYLDTSWTDEITGLNSNQGGGTNQTEQYVAGTGEGKRITSRILNQEDTQLLGITKISIKISPAFVPQVDIDMTDIQGRVLFEQGENSPYSAFMQMPYPLFKLTIKGYYGKAVTYELMLKSFNAVFDPSTGNYNISTSYVARTHALLADTNLMYLYALPYMYEKTIEIENTQTTGDGVSTPQVDVRRTTRGYDKLKEVYSIYKSKGLIDQDFPEITLNQLIMKLEKFNEFVEQSYSKEDMSVLNDVVEYQDNIVKYKRRIYPNITANWFNKYIDQNSRYVLNDGRIIHQFKSSLGLEAIEEALEDLRAIINNFNKKLKDNNTFGEGGKYEINNKEYSVEIPVNIKPSDLIIKNISIDDIDVVKTYNETNVEPLVDETLYRQELITRLNAKSYIVDVKTFEVKESPTSNTYIVFGENIKNVERDGKSFLGKLDSIENTFDTFKNQIEERLSKALSDKVTSIETGIGFNPTVKNMLAVICASADAFYRLMDDVHEKAWDKRKDPVRLRAIIEGKTDGVDSKDSIESITENGQLRDESVVYPWPHYYEKEFDSDSNPLWVQKYPGQEDVIFKIQGNDFSRWPEIEFVEQFTKALLEKDSNPRLPDYVNPVTENTYLYTNAVEYPFTVRPFDNLSAINLLYEIYERVYLISNYTKLYKSNSSSQDIYKVVSNFEYKNIFESIIESTNLMELLKNYRLSVDNFDSILSSLSLDGQGTYWNKKESGFFNIEYINEYQTTPFGIYSIVTTDSKFKSNVNQDDSSKNLINYLNSSEFNTLTFTDTYPINNVNWLSNNLANGSSVGDATEANKTNNSIGFNKDRNIIANYTEDIDNRYLTYLGFSENYPDNPDQTTGGVSPLSTKIQFNSSQDYLEFFTNKNRETYILTESELNYGTNYSTNNYLTPIQTTSLINTPYFMNALINGVDNDGVTENPYAALGYLYLNSLPLPTLREKLIDGDGEFNDYIYASLNKVSAIHKLPYLWILKYGSIWHRYKKYIEDDTDILDSVWGDFDNVNAYDPTTSALTKQYTIKIKDNSGTSNRNIVYSGNNNYTINFYPKVVNSLYRFFTNEDIITDYAQTDLTYLTDTYNLNTRLTTTNYETVSGVRKKVFNTASWFDISNNSSFYNKKNKLLIIPSHGINKGNTYLRYEISVDGVIPNNLEFTDKPIVNGTARPLWGVSNFGYYNNDYIRKPEYNEYIKVIDTNNNEQLPFNLINKESTSEYSKIDEIFAVFDRQVLDEFERHFLNFCKKPKENNTIVIDDEDDAYKFNISTALETIFITDKPDKDDKIATYQLNNFVSKTTELLTNKDVVLKLGNVEKFNRRSVLSFVDDSDLKVDNSIDFDIYQQDALPTATNNVTLAISKTNHPDAWDALYTYIGEYEESNLQYDDNGSYITDFFIDFNIKFTAPNVRDLSQIIKIYATEKLNNSSITTTQFQTFLANYLTEQNTFRDNILENIFQSLNQELPNVQVSLADVDTKLNGNIPKNELWYTFKNLNDRWVAGQNFKTRTIFEDFLFLDRANRPVGDKIVIDIEEFRYFLSSDNPRSDIYSLITLMLQKNNFVVMPVPTYTNFYGANARVPNAQPVRDLQSIADSTFGTFLNVDTYQSRPKFLAVYVGKPSEYLDQKRNTNYRFKNDSFDMVRASQNPLITVENSNNYSDRNKCVGFNVDFGTRNQGIFKSIALDTSQRKAIAPTFKVIEELGQQVSGQRVAQQTVSIYEFYKTGSYNCNVTSMGNAMIQPTMYFNLRHVPMFYGPYLILNVNHDITPQEFITQFEGIRIPKYSLELPKDLAMSVNRDILNKYKERLRRINKDNYDDTTPTVTNTSTINYDGNTLEQQGNGCVSHESNEEIDFVDLVVTNVKQDVVIKYLKIVSANETLKNEFIYSINVIERNNKDKCFNNNLFSVSTQKEWRKSIRSRFSGQVCISVNNKNISYAAFSNPETSIDVMLDFYDNVGVILQTMMDSFNITKVEAITYMWYKTWRAVDNNYFNGGKTITTIYNDVLEELNNTENKKIIDNAKDLVTIAIKEYGQ